jgi:N utilization substance protein B
MKTPKRQAREVALQALYAWQLSGGDPIEQLKTLDGYGEADQKLAQSLVRGVLESAGELRTVITPHADRAFERLSPVERAILYIGTYELSAQPKTPFKVVLNEAIELGKSFGGTDGHRFVNGVLEKIALALRPEEVAKARTRIA